MKIFIIGTGLIGGSMALDIQSLYDGAVLFGIDDNKNHLDEALELGIIHKKATVAEIPVADIVILAVPVDAGLELLPEILDKVQENTLVFDVGSTKFPICEAAANHKNRHQFLATHPIAGTEFSGPSAAVKKLFEGKTNIICEIEKTAFKLQEGAMELFGKLGMRIRYMDPKSHDKHIAYVSHLSHISSFMLGKTVIEKEKDERDIFDMAGSGFESTVRLAKSSPAMWTPIFRQNKKHVIKSLDEYISNLTHFRQLLEEEDYDAVFNEMHNTNKINEILKGINLKK
jgi:prephenate dehydrogenase